jgi:hypothetical protein
VVKRIEAMPLMVKPVDMCAMSAFPHCYDNPVRQTPRVRPSHDGANAGVYGLASVYIVAVHVFTSFVRVFVFISLTCHRCQ